MVESEAWRALPEPKLLPSTIHVPRGGERGPKSRWQLLGGLLENVKLVVTVWADESRRGGTNKQRRKKGY